jgi:purine nucleosidase
VPECNHLMPQTESKITWPNGVVDVVLDTDTYNEIDDQFALVYALMSVQRMNVQAIYAAPFHNDRSDSPADGMAKSYEEAERILSLLGHTSNDFLFKGSMSWLPDNRTPVSSPAVDDLISRARARTDQPLYIIAIGAITNVVSAILAAPDIKDRIVVLWLGGHSLHWHHTREFNLQGDLTASQVLFDCGVPLVLFPCLLVAEALATTLAELDKHIRPAGDIGAYLYEIFEGYGSGDLRSAGASKVIWDLAPVAWLVNQNWVETVVTHSPILTSDVTWSRDRNRHLIRVATRVHRDGIFTDLFSKLSSTTSH